MKGLSYSFLRAICALVIGLVLVMFPDQAGDYFVITIGVIFLVPSLVSIIGYFAQSTEMRSRFPIEAGDVSSMKSAPSGNYTLQLSSSSNYENLNNWAKKEKLDRYVVYETSRNGQPWYVLVSGIYSSKDEAKRAVTSLPPDVQAKNPWAKPLHQVQADLK